MSGTRLKIPERLRRFHVPRLLEIGLAAALLSLALMAAAVTGEYEVGPGKVQISLRPQLKGATEVSVPPFGSIRASTHWAPVAVVLSPTSVDTRSAQALVESRPTQVALVESLREDLIAALKKYALRLLIGGIVAGLLTAALARTRSAGELIMALGVGVAVPVGLVCHRVRRVQPRRLSPADAHRSAQPVAGAARAGPPVRG